MNDATFSNESLKLVTDPEFEPALAKVFEESPGTWVPFCSLVPDCHEVLRTVFVCWVPDLPPNNDGFRTVLLFNVATDESHVASYNYARLVRVLSS